MKKITSLFLAIVMVALLAVTALPLSVFAATGTYTSDADAIAAGMYFRIGAADATNGALYGATLKETVAAATTADVTIYQIQSYSGAEKLSIADSKTTPVAQNIVLDGQGYDYTTSTGYQEVFNISSLTVQNYNKLYLERGFWFYADSLTFKDITTLETGVRPIAVMNDAVADDAATDEVESAVLSFINVASANFSKNSTGSEPGIRLGGDNATARSGNMTLNVTNSHLNWGSTNAGSGGHNSSLIATNKNEGNVVINVDGSSSLGLSCASGSSAAQLLYYGSAGTNVTLNLAEGAEMIFAGKGSNYSFFSGNGTFTLNDNGAVYTLKAGTSSIKFPGIEGKVFVSGETTVISGGAYANSSTADMSFNAMVSSDDYTDEEAVAVGYKFRVGAVADQNYYATFAEAVNLVKASTAETAPTIYMLSDYSTTEYIALNGAYTVKVDGQGHTLTKTGGNNYFMAGEGGTDVTFEDINLVLLGGFISEGDSSFTLKNVTATTSVRPLWKNSDDNDSQVASGNSMVMDNVTATMTATLVSANAVHGQNLILSERYGQGTLVLKNGTVLSHEGEAGSVVGNNAIVNIAANSVLNVTVGSGCEMINNLRPGEKDGTTYSNGACMYFGSTKNSTVTLEEGSKLTVKGETLATPYFLRSSNEMTTVQDNGCTYTVEADVNKVVDVPLPTLASVKGGNLLAYSTEAGLIGSTLKKNTEATADVVITAIGFDSSQFDIVDGASIRKAAPYGIRFTANIDKALYDQLIAADANVEFGIVIGAKRFIFGENFFTNLDDQKAENYAKIVCENLNDATVGDTAVKQMVAAVYINGDENLESAGKTQFETTMTACAYFTIHFSDGTSQTIWAEYDATANSRSLFDVAKAYYEDATITDGSNKNNEVINKILTACGYTLAA